MASASERAYTLLRKNLVAGRYRPNQRLVELDLADELKASRTPIRQALQRLEIEGFIEPSRHGWVIKDYSVEEITHIYEVRIALESEASRLAAERCSPADVAKMQHHLDQSTQAIEQQDITAFVKHHDEFHGMIVRSGKNPILADAVRLYREHPYNRRVAHTYRDEDLREAGESHRLMLEAIREGRPEDAGALTRAHLELSRSITLQRFAGML